MMIVSIVFARVENLAHPATYHKLVNTTPKPNATKKRRGELVGPEPEPLLDWLVVAAGIGVADVGPPVSTVDDMIVGACSPQDHQWKRLLTMDKKIDRNQKRWRR